jgi:hypothetical protein
MGAALLCGDRDQVGSGAEVVLPVACGRRVRKDQIAAGRLGLDQDWLL